MRPWLQTLLLGAGFGAAFLLGQRLPLLTGTAAGAAAQEGLPATPLAATGADQPVLLAQGRSGPVNPPPAAPTPVAPTQPGEPTVVYTEEVSSAAVSNNGFLAVTGSYGIGTSVLYLVDTKSRQLAVYEARGGTQGQRQIVLVGARRIDLDLQLEGYNDRSEYDYRGLQDLFRRRGRKDPDVRTGLEAPMSPRR